MIKQYNAQCYYVRVPEPFGAWGYFTVTPEIGLLQCCTDYGDYTHRWDRPGKDLKTFLMGLNEGYVLGKVARKETDVKAMTRMMHQIIAKQRQDGVLDEEEARDALRELDDVSTEVDLIVWQAKHEPPFEGEDWVMDYNSQAKAFWKHLWPLFIEQLKQESAQSATVTGAPIAITRYTTMTVVGGLERTIHYYPDCLSMKPGDIMQTTLGVGHPDGVCGTCVQRMEGKWA